MLLAIDVGNTNVVMGVYQKHRLAASWRLNTNINATADEFAVFVLTMASRAGVDLKRVKKTVVSCVVPPMMTIIESFCQTYTDTLPVKVTAETVSWMPIFYRDSNQMGADRLVNAVAAFEKYQTELIVIDLGTATTLDAVSGNGEYLGGAIAPGIGICTDALYARAPKLPRVELGIPVEKAIATDTVNSIKSGIIFGYAGLVDGVVARMKKEMGGRPKVIATGGLAKVMETVCQSIEVIEPDLMLEGLRIIGEKL